MCVCVPAYAFLIKVILVQNWEGIVVFFRVLTEEKEIHAYFLLHYFVYSETQTFHKKQEILAQLPC